MPVLAPLFLGSAPTVSLASPQLAESTPGHPELPTDASAVFGAAAYPPVAGAGVGSKSCQMTGDPGTLNGASRAERFHQRWSTPNSEKSEVMPSDAVKFVNMCKSGGKEASELHAPSHSADGLNI